jgi:hypothetical protein
MQMSTETQESTGNCTQVAQGRPGRKRAVYNGLPDRMYERIGKRVATWWVKEPDSTTRVVYKLNQPANEEQIAAARQYAIHQCAGAASRSTRPTFDELDGWVANRGRVDPKALAMKDGMPAWARALWHDVRSRAKARKMLFTLTQEEFRQMVERADGKCEVSGIDLTLTIRTKKGPYGPSVDRIDCGDGYTAENTRIVCIALNYAMSTWGIEALIPIAKAITLKYQSGGDLVTGRSMK